MESYVWNFLGMGISIGFMVDRLLDKKWVWAFVYGYAALMNVLAIVMQVR